MSKDTGIEQLCKSIQDKKVHTDKPTQKGTVQSTDATQWPQLKYSPKSQEPRQLRHECLQPLVQLNAYHQQMEVKDTTIKAPKQMILSQKELQLVILKYGKSLSKEEALRQKQKEWRTHDASPDKYPSTDLNLPPSPSVRCTQQAANVQKAKSCPQAKVSLPGIKTQQTHGYSDKGQRINKIREQHLKRTNISTARVQKYKRTRDAKYQEDYQYQPEKDSMTSKQANDIAENNTASTVETTIDQDKLSSAQNSEQNEEEDQDNLKILQEEAKRVSTQKQRKYMYNHGYQMKDLTEQAQPAYYPAGMTIFDQNASATEQKYSSCTDIACLTYEKVEKPEIRIENLDNETLRSLQSQAEQTPVLTASHVSSNINASALLRSDNYLGVIPCDSFEEGSKELPLVESQSPVSAQMLLRSDIK